MSSRFRSNFIKVARANVLAQLLPLLALPLLTRLYTPDDFGVLALFSSATSLLLAFSTWRFDWSIPNTSSETLTSALLLLGVLALLIFSGSSFAVLWFWKEQLYFWRGFEVLGSLILLLPVAVVVGGLQELLRCWYVRKAEMSNVATSRMAQSVASTGFNVAAGYAGLSAMGLITSAVVSAGVGVSVLMRGAQSLKKSFVRLSIKRLKVGLIKYWSESTASTVGSVVNVASVAVVPMLLVQYYSPKEVGWYALMYQLALGPIGLMTTALSQSFWAEAAQLVKSDLIELRRLFLKFTKLLMLVAIPVVLICTSGTLFVGPILGEDKWAGAGSILAALSPMIAGIIVVQPLTHLVVHKKQKWKMYLDIAKLTAVIALIVLFPKLEGELHVLIFYLSSIVLFSNLILFFLNLKCLKK